MSGYNRILAFDRSTGSWQNVSCSNTGSLQVEISGSSSGGDASASNQILQLTQAQQSNVALFNQLETQTDRVLYDLDVIANRINNVTEEQVNSNLAICTRLDKNTYTNSNLHVRDDELKLVAVQSNLAVNSKLSSLLVVEESSNQYLESILAKSSGLPYQKTKYNINAVPILAPDTVPSFTIPPVASGIDGWYFKNTNTNQPSQIYYYSYLNQNLAVPARQKTYTIDEVVSGYAIVSILNVNATEGLPMLGIYSRPQGAGDAVSGFFRSRKVYTIPTSAPITQGLQVMLYWGLAPDSRLFPDIVRIELNLASSVGPGLGSEQLAYLSLNTDSLALAGNSEYIVSHCGFVIIGDKIHDTQLTSELKQATEANQLTQITLAEQSNLAINQKLASSIIELEAINDTLNDVTDGTKQLYVTLSGVDDSVSIMGYNSVLAMPETITLTTSSGMRALDVNIANQITGYASEFTLGDINEKIFKCNTDSVLIDSSNPINVLGLAKVVNTLNNAYLTVDSNQNLRVTLDNQISGFALESSLSSLNGKVTKCDTDNVTVSNQISGFALESTLSSLNGKVTKCDTDNVTVSNQISGFALESTLSSLNGKVTKCDTDNIIIPGTVDTHLYAEHNSSWLGVKASNSGNLLVNSSTQDGDGTSITSTTVSSKQGLDVNVINTVPVSGSVSVSNIPAIQTVTGTVSVTGSSVSVSNFPQTQAVSGTISVTGSSVSVSNFPASQVVSGSVNVSGTVNSRLQDGSGNNITSTLLNTKQGLDVNIANNSTTNDYSKIGINTYQITPIRKTYQMNGMSQNNTVCLAGGQNNNIDYRSFTFGVAGLAFPVYFNSQNTTRTLIYDYINSNGNLVENATLTLTANTWVPTPNILGVNKWTVTPQFAFNSPDVVFASVNVTSTGSIGSKSVSSYMNGIITIPNGYIGYVTNIISYVSAANNVVLEIWDTNGTRTDAIEFPSTGYYQFSAPYFGGFSGVLTAGMAVACAFENTGTSRNTYCTVIMEAI